MNAESVNTNAISVTPQLSFHLPTKFQFLFRPMRYKVPYGGRGSAKSTSVARALISLSLDPSPLFGNTRNKLRILCARELQVSIADSVHKLLSDSITAMGLEDRFVLTQNAIVSNNGSEFIFAGIRNNVTKIKSMEAIDICWVEEAERVSKNSWEVLIPTIRKAGSEIWVTFNPEEEKDATAQRFLIQPDATTMKVVKVNWEDNPWFHTTALVAEKDYAYKVDADNADWVWGGNFRRISAKQILRGKCQVEEFVVDNQKRPGWDGPWFGLDFGYGSDPLSAHKYWGRGNTLYVEHELYGHGVELNDIAKLMIAQLPGVQYHTVWADNSRPDAISHVKTGSPEGGVPAIPLLDGAEKWAGSVDAGIMYLRSLEAIVIHPRCKHWVEESKAYSWKVDQRTQDILPVPEDKHNHCIDNARYALWKAIKAMETPVQLTLDAIESRVAQGQVDEYELPGFRTI